MTQVRRVGKEKVWLVDSGCSRHMTGDSRWFSSLARAPGDETITFGDASSGRVIAKGTVRINASFILKDVALVRSCSTICFPFLSLPMTVSR